MISIAIHGLPQEKGEGLRERIFALLRSKPYVGQIGIAVYPPQIGDNNGSSLQISLPYGFPEKDILRTLKPLKIDIKFS